MSESPKVLSIVCDLMRGGTEGQCARVAMNLCGKGHVHRVAVFIRQGYFLDEVERRCEPVLTIGIRRFLSVDTWREVRRLTEFIIENEFDLVHAWDANAAVFGSLAARRAGVPFITSRRDMGEIYTWYKLWAMNRADVGAEAVVVNALAVKSMLEDRGLPSDRIRKINNVIDLEEFDRLRESPFSVDLPPGPRVGMVARLDPEKDSAALIRAAQLVIKKFPDVSFLLAGDGTEREALETLCRDLGISNNVVFLGEVFDVPALIKEIDIGVLVPRSNEGLSNSILEYMAGGVPVVATDCGGNVELVRSGETGFLVSVGDIAEIARSIEGLLSDPERGAAMGRAARRFVEENFSPDDIAAQFLALYNEVLSVWRSRQSTSQIL